MDKPTTRDLFASLLTPTFVMLSRAKHPNGPAITTALARRKGLG